MPPRLEQVSHQDDLDHAHHYHDDAVRQRPIEHASALPFEAVTVAGFPGTEELLVSGHFVKVVGDIGKEALH